MTIPLPAKCIAYLCAALLLAVFATVFVRGLIPPPNAVSPDSEETLLEDIAEANDAYQAEAHRRATLYLFAVGCTLMGAAVYGWRAYIRRHREHRFDACLWLMAGILILAYSLYALFSFHLGDDAAISLIRIILWLTPLPFAVRGITLAWHSDMPDRARRPVQVVSIAAAAAIPALYVLL